MVGLWAALGADGRAILFAWVVQLLMTRVSSQETKDRALEGFFHAFPSPSAFKVGGDVLSVRVLAPRVSVPARLIRPGA